MLTQEELKRLLHYDPETGVFTRLRTGRKVGSHSDQGYLLIAIKIDGKSILFRAHRLAWLYTHGHFPPEHTDHVNGFRDDNRLVNLRPANSYQNGYNTGLRKNNTTGFKGVTYFVRTGRWVAQIRAHGKKVSLGYHSTAEEAGAAYLRAAKQLHDEFFGNTMVDTFEN